jgi:hypothetical protein
MDSQSLHPFYAFIGVGLIALCIWWIMRQGKRILEEQNARLARSQPAQAKVLEIGKSIAQVRNGTTIVKLRIEVMPANTDTYPVTTVWEIQQAALSQIQPGQYVAVKIDADDNQIIYPNVGWAEFSKIYWETWVKEKQKKRNRVKHNQTA